MNTNSNAKIAQAVFGFLEAVHGKRDAEAISELIKEMLDASMTSDVNAKEDVMQNPLSQWSRLDHDLRSPMNGILGFTEILLEELKNPDLKWKAQQIQVSALKLMKILENSSIYGFKPTASEERSEASFQQEPHEDGVAKPGIPVRKKTKSAGKKLPNVLIVEDNMVNSNLLQHHIKKYCHLFFSQTGKAAIEVTKNEKIDAIFMDINLGKGMDGTQAMLEIRRQTGNEKIPVIAVTGYAGREDRNKFIEAGFDDFVAKPFERQDVVSIIERLFKQED
ncbi:MAG: response regulator [Bacteroidetes bacterium]|nr:response regulator [Bacteroidota bacterium]